MKLSQILTGRDRLQQLMADVAQQMRWRDAEPTVQGFVMDNVVIRDRWEVPINRCLHQLNRTYGNLFSVLNDAEAWLHQQQLAQDKDYLEQGDRLYAQISQIALIPNSHPLLPWQSNELDTVLDRRLVLDAETNEAVFDRIRSMAEWKHTGMLIRPAKEGFVDTMVHLDPLYLVDNNIDLLKPARTRFPELYQRRLRYYSVQDFQDNPLAALPDQQFGCSVIYYFFNFKSMPVIRRYLTDLWHKTRPGGIVAFTLNDCDYAHNAALFEQKYACFTPGRMVRDHAVQLGFEVSYELHTPGELHWFELRRPGHKESLKGGQALAEILKIS
jgi:hypothetical protein